MPTLPIGLAVSEMYERLRLIARASERQNTDFVSIELFEMSKKSKYYDLINRLAKTQIGAC
jgi:hypothetical protein